MERVRLTKQQDVELKMMLNTFESPKSIVKMHAKQKSKGIGWVSFPFINDLTVNELESALYDGYEVENGLSVLQNAYEVAMKNTSSKEELEADFDYQLLTLHEAIENGDEELKRKTLRYLKELQKQIEEF